MEPIFQVDNFGSAIPIITVLSILLTLAWIAVLLRAYTRIRIVHSWGWDDTLLVVGLVSQVDVCIWYGPNRTCQTTYTVEIASGLTFCVLLANKSTMTLSEIYLAINASHHHTLCTNYAHCEIALTGDAVLLYRKHDYHQRIVRHASTPVSY